MLWLLRMQLLELLRRLKLRLLKLWLLRLKLLRLLRLKLLRLLRLSRPVLRSFVVDTRPVGHLLRETAVFSRRLLASGRGLAHGRRGLNLGNLAKPAILTQFRKKSSSELFSLF